MKTYEILGKPPDGEWIRWKTTEEEDGKFKEYFETRDLCLSLQQATEDNGTGWSYKMTITTNIGGTPTTREII